MKEDIEIYSLLYVSQCLVAPQCIEEQIEEIVARSRKRNAVLGITGCLVFTGKSFAQILEGPKSHVEEVMASIERDPRHAQIDVLEKAVLKVRRCSDWSLGYFGPSLLVQRVIQRALDHRFSEAALRDLTDLITRFQAA